MKFIGKKEKEVDKNINPNTPEENKFVSVVTGNQSYAEQGNRQNMRDFWDDEYKMYSGKHWDTKQYPRSQKHKKDQFNFYDNWIFKNINGMRSALTASTPEATFDAIEPDDEFAVKKLEHAVPNILDKNKFPYHWRRIVDQFIQHGPAIGMVTWDNDWIGGSGPNRWIGEVRVQYQKKDEIFFDPAIIDLEERLQDCAFITRKLRKKLTFFKDKWPDKGQYVTAEMFQENEYKNIDEGPDPQQATLIEYWHKGTPQFISEEDKQRFLEKAQYYENLETGKFAFNEPVIGFPWKVQEYKDKAKGILKGIHCAYVAGNVLLDYKPYCYEDGLYPFAYRVLYYDEEQPYGIGETRNMISPQVMYNMADEIEIAATAKQGLGNKIHSPGAFSKTQKDEYRKNRYKGGQLFEANDPEGIKDEQPTMVPQSLQVFKESKKRSIDEVAQFTSIQQGNSVGSRTPFSVVRELGARADQRNKEKINILSEFYKDMIHLVVNRILEFYTEERQIRLMGEDNTTDKEIAKAVKGIAKMSTPEEQFMAMQQLLPLIQNEEQPKSMTFSNMELKRVWEREAGKFEEFIPDFDIKVSIRDARPNDQDYVTNVADRALQMGAFDPESYYEAITTGKLPRIDDVQARLQSMPMQEGQRGTPSQPINM